MEPVFMNFNSDTAFVILVADRTGTDRAVKKVCYDKESIDFEIDNYVKQEGAFVNTQNLRVANDYETHALVIATNAIIREIAEVVA